jgi:DNA-binding protein H-NS
MLGRPNFRPEGRDPGPAKRQREVGGHFPYCCNASVSCRCIALWDNGPIALFASESPPSITWGAQKMTKYDFETMSIDDLWSLHERIGSVLEVKIQDEKRRLEHWLDELGRRSVASQADIRHTRPSPKGEPKFRNPNDPSITWSGRGRHPRWLNELIAAGRAINDFRIATF